MKIWATDDEIHNVDTLIKKVVYSSEPSEYKNQMEFLMETWLKLQGIKTEVCSNIESTFIKYASEEAIDAYEKARVGFVEYRLSDDFDRATEKFEWFMSFVEHEMLKGKYKVTVGEEITHWKFGVGWVVNVKWTRFDVFFDKYGIKKLHIAFLGGCKIDYEKNA